LLDHGSQRTVTGAGVQLALLEAGDATRPTLVFVHGYPDTKELWLDVMGLLSARFHVVAYDVRGAGSSSAPRGPRAYDVTRLGDDLAAVIAATSPGAPVHLVGHDWGAIAGWEFASDERFSGRLASFTAIAGPSLDQIALGGRGVLRHPTPVNLARAVGRLRRSWYVLALLTPGVPTLVWRGPLARGRWRWLLENRERLPPRAAHPAPSIERDGRIGANLYRRNIPRRMLRPRDVPARVPVQLILPSGEHFISPGYYEHAERHAPELRRRVLAGSHWAPRSHPDLIARWVGEFATDVQGGLTGGARPWVRGGGLEQLAGRLALVTGAGSGIGRATALALAAAGAGVVIVDRDGDAASSTAELVGGDAHTYVCDVSDATAMEGLAAEVIEQHGVPDVVVNNAGIGLAGSFLDTGFDDWRRVLDINLMGVVHGARLFGRAMVQRGAGGQIVNTASAAAFQPVKELAAYGASKAAVLMLSECLRAELSPFGIGVTAVCPGVVATNITRTTRFVGRPESEQERLQGRVTSLYQRRNFTPEQVAREIMGAIAADTPVAVVTPEAKLAHALARVAPGLLRRLARLDSLPV
jgi:NAD(P)-dependent dehydrogenase (short-subunit alcohol dehydrogenase family)/pimeloyl-ACP methyl ester carboxylesterase